MAKRSIHRFQLVKDIQHRNVTTLTGPKHVRLVRFHTPSSFYLQVVEEDATYQLMEEEMQKFYEILPSFYMSDPENSENQPILKKVLIKDLEASTLLAAKVDGKWGRYSVINSHTCRSIDNGWTHALTEEMEKVGIYLLDDRFLELVPRVILCGCSNIYPKSNRRFRWREKACRVLKEVIDVGPLEAAFVSGGFFLDSAYVLLYKRNPPGDVIHLNYLLVAFDLALPTGVTNQQPLLPFDAPIFENL